MEGSSAVTWNWENTRGKGPIQMYAYLAKECGANINVTG